jgi:hypothetical protein
MKHVLTSLFTIVLMLGLFSFIPQDSRGIQATQRYAHIVNFSFGQCSGTAVAEHAVMTATHCVDSTNIPIVIIDNNIRAFIDGRVDDGNDHTVILLRGITFKDYTQITITDLDIGQRIFFGGAAADYGSLLFREGRISTFYTVDKMRGYLIQTITIGGDSGSGIFDDRGRLVSAVSLTDIRSDGTQSICFMGAFKLQFTPQQLRQIYGYRHTRQIPYIPL